jgi:molybdenum cofactor cytidylyltransferase
MIAAVVLAAGQSRRMGQTKLLLPWQDTTVIGKVVATLVAADIGEIVVVTGGEHAAISEVLEGQPARCVQNPRYAHDEMLVSCQVGLAALSVEARAALVVLGDQPQMHTATVRAVVTAYKETGCPLVAPSYQRRRGHPILVGRELFTHLLALPPETTLREFLNACSDEIWYANVTDESLFKDLDTPEDYADRTGKPKPGS